MLWNGKGNNPADTLDAAIRERGPAVAINIKLRGLAMADVATDPLLIHVNPPRSDVETDPFSRTFYTFASDYVFTQLEDELKLGLYADIGHCFNTGTAITKYGEPTAQYLFKLIAIRSLVGQTIRATRLKS